MNEPYAGRGTNRPGLYSERQREPEAMTPCPVCDFVAHSARALGAHMRAHRRKLEKKS